MTLVTPTMTGNLPRPHYDDYYESNPDLCYATEEFILLRDKVTETLISTGLLRESDICYSQDDEVIIVDHSYDYFGGSASLMELRKYEVQIGYESTPHNQDMDLIIKLMTEELKLRSI
jgi:hypothetical protein